jgi:hypothetical protein
VHRPPRLATFGLAALVCAAWTIVAGKDINWDLLNYHYYLPFELLAGRMDQDFFAASAQSYLNPLGYLPFYAMVAAGWHSVAVSLVLAALHSVNIALLFLIAWRLFAHLPPRRRVVFSSLGAALGAATAVFWAMIGTSFIDPLLTPAMLAGLLALLGEGRALQRAALAGALFGVAAALKYSNAIFALAALPLAFAMPGSCGSARLRASAAFAGAGLLAVAVLAGPWSWMLMSELGNPVFPLMNGWFKSPYAPAVNLGAERFAPPGFADALLFPFRMTMLSRALYVETFAPDIRFAALVVAVLALPMAPATRRKSEALAARALRAVDTRVLAFFALSAALWLGTSANGRYGLLVLLLGGLCFVRLAERLLPERPALGVISLVLFVQLAMSIIAAPSRWFIAEPWSYRWLPFDVPERARREPALYLTVEVLPMAAVAPFVNPASAFVNLSGQRSLAPDSPRLLSLLKRHRGHVRVLGRSLQLDSGKPLAGEVAYYDKILRRVGYQIDPDDCYAIGWRPDSADLLSRAANRLAGDFPPHESLAMTSCALHPVERDPGEVGAERRISALFDRVEKSCPHLFHGETAVTDPLREGWGRYYGAFDARLEAHGEHVILNRYRAGTAVDLGRTSDWERGDLPAACR